MAHNIWQPLRQVTAKGRDEPPHKVMPQADLHHYFDAWSPAGRDVVRHCQRFVDHGLLVISQMLHVVLVDCFSKGTCKIILQVDVNVGMPCHTWSIWVFVAVET